MRVAGENIFPAAKDKEDLVQIFGIDSHARVADVKFSFAGSHGATDVNLSRLAVAHVLDGVVDQVLKNLAKAGLFAVQYRQIGIDQQRDVPCLQIVVEHVCQVRDQAARLDHFGFEPAGFDARQFEQLADQIRLDNHVLLDAFQTVDDVFVEFLAMFHQQHRGHAADIA